MANAFTRRSFVYGSAAMLAFAKSMMRVRDSFDHVLLGTSDLARGVDWLEKRTGVRAVIGGVHPGRGTRNALISLGGLQYLEIIAPDPAQRTTTPQFQLSGLAEPRLINFAVRTRDIDATAAFLQGNGVHTSGIRDGSRRTPSGALLQWKALGVEGDFQSDEINPIPFFIEWSSGSTNPSKDASVGCAIEDLRFEHPRADELAVFLRSLGLEAKIARADQVRIIALLQTPKGRIEIT